MAEKTQPAKTTPAKTQPATRGNTKPGDGVTVSSPGGTGPAPGEAQTVTDLGPSTRTKRCTVRGCDYLTTPGDEICSYHAIDYTPDGHKRTGGA